MNTSYERYLSKLAVPVSHSDGGAVQALDRGIHALRGRTLVIAFILDAGIVCMIVWREHAIFDEQLVSIEIFVLDIAIAGPFGIDSRYLPSLNSLVVSFPPTIQRV